MFMRFITHPVVRFSIKCYETAAIVVGVFILLSALKHLVSVII